uniref:NADH-ubiquinone oxidoreductase chain 1 n=1 Tax=Leucosolenia complicata TaxID=433461 RepID=A0A140CUR9_9METZ|nr:NADH dehydrogenase subunit 1 [Leucosolenia complicata]
MTLVADASRSLLLLGTVAFFVLWERRLMGAAQGRMGPSRAGRWGLLQPLADGAKLLSKGRIRPARGEADAFFAWACVALSLPLLGWSFLPWAGREEGGSAASVLLSSAAATLMLWAAASGARAAGSGYALLGAVRGAVQGLSVELAWMLSLVPALLARESLAVPCAAGSDPASMSPGSWGFPLLGALGALLLAEGHRPPFDLMEGESELVSGHSVEHAGFPFAGAFLAEQAAGWMACAVLAAVWVSPLGDPSWFFATGTAAFFLLASRLPLPRARADLLADRLWKAAFPAALGAACAGFGAFAR